MIKKTKYILTLIIHIFVLHHLIGQQAISNDSIRKKSVNFNFEKPLETIDNLQISGYYRFIANYRHLNTSYSHLESNKNNIFVGDDGQIPQLMLNITGNTSSNTSFGTDLFLWTPLTGAGEVENVKGLNLGVSLYGNFSTKIGNFGVKTGGINWYALSPFTFQTNKGHNRYSVFERNPWDPTTSKIEGRYDDFYAIGEINQDQRWGNQAFQGLIVEATQLPNRFSFTTMIGKTQFDGGYSALPNTSYGGKIQKSYGQQNNFISFNTFNNTSILDSLSSTSSGFNMATLEWKHSLNKIKIYTEIGAGKRFLNEFNENWGEAISLKISSEVFKKSSLELHFFLISPQVFNNSSIFINSSIQQNARLSSSQTQPVLIPVSSAILPIGQLSNNRQGLEINTQLNIGKLKTSIGYSNSTEIDNLTSKITYSHAFNNLALSRFWRWNFPSNVGPYNNLSKIYRSVIETINITDVDASGRPLLKKYFNTVEVNAKYKTNLLGKDIMLFYLGSFNSVQNFASAFVNFTEKAYVRNYGHQLDAYMKLNNHLVWTNYVGYERIIANYDTQTDEISRRPKNQTGWSVATGLDIELSKGVGLFVKERWMDYYDSSFSKDKYDGFETTIELKMFF